MAYSVCHSSSLIISEMLSENVTIENYNDVEPIIHSKIICLLKCDVKSYHSHGP